MKLIYVVTGGDNLLRKDNIKRRKKLRINCWHKYMRLKVKPKAIHDPVLAFRDFKKILVSVKVI